jgi:hypothetical protein
LSTTETEQGQQHLTVVSDGEQQEPVVTPEDMQESEVEGTVCPEPGCGAVLKNRKTLSMHMRGQHGKTLSGRAVSKIQGKKEKPKLSKREDFNNALGKIIFPEGLPVYGDLSKMEGMVTRYLNVCEDAWKLREEAKSLARG